MTVDARASATDPASAIPPTSAPSATRLLDRAVWRDAALVWLVQHTLILLFAVAGVRGVDPRYPLALMYRHWTSWDGGIYTTLAQGGYVSLWQTAFYPLFPGLERLLTLLTGLSAPAAGILIAAIASLLAFGLLRALIERELGAAVARRGLLYLALFPTALYFLAPYTESLFLLLSVACFLALRRQRWLLAGLLAALAALTRPVGVLLIVPMLVEYLVTLAARHPTWREWPGWRALPSRMGTGERRALAALLAGVALPALAVVGWFGALRLVLGQFSPLRVEQANWDRSLTLPGAGIARASAALLNGVSPGEAVHTLLDLAFVVLFIVLTVALWRRLPPTYIAYAWGSLLLVLMTPLDGWAALASDMRYMLVVFPLFMRLGQWGARPWANALILSLSLPLLAALTIIFTLGGWVA